MFLNYAEAFSFFIKLNAEPSLHRLTGDWLYIDDFTDSYGTDAANQIEIVFDVLMESSITSEECFNDFKEFYKIHPHAFSDKIKTLTKKTAKAIASSFSGNNKSELILLAKIDLLLN